MSIRRNTDIVQNLHSCTVTGTDFKCYRLKTSGQVLMYEVYMRGFAGNLDAN